MHRIEAAAGFAFTYTCVVVAAAARRCRRWTMCPSTVGPVAVAFPPRPTPIAVRSRDS